MILIIGLFALVASALFTGAAFYIHAVEQPARLKLDDRALLTQWQPAYRRGTLMQAPLAMAATLFGLAAWWLTKDWRWLLGAGFMLLPWVFTLTFIDPLNRRLKAMHPDEAGPESRRLIKKWGGMHFTRVTMGLMGMLHYLLAVITAASA